MGAIEEIRAALRAALAAEAEVRFALLFGSAMRRGPERARDVDVAVSLSSSWSLLELGRLEGRLERALGREVDLVDLDQATTLLRWEVARDGLVIACRDERALVEFRARASLEYLDLEPHRVRQARGLARALGGRAVTRLDLVRDKVRRLRHVVALLERSTPDDPAVLAADEDRLHLLAFRVYLGMQEAIDLASHVIADEGWGPVATLREHFDVLAREGALRAEIATSLADGVKIRNLIGHAYGDVDPVKLHAGARALPPLLDGFCHDVLAFAERAH